MGPSDTEAFDVNQMKLASGIGPGQRDSSRNKVFFDSWNDMQNAQNRSAKTPILPNLPNTFKYESQGTSTFKAIYGVKGLGGAAK